MAKKVVATIQKGEGRNTTRVIKMIKSPKTGSYAFKTEMLPNEKVKEFFAKK